MRTDDRSPALHRAGRFAGALAVAGAAQLAAAAGGSEFN